MGAVFRLWKGTSKFAFFLHELSHCKHGLHRTARWMKQQGWKSESGLVPDKMQASLYEAAFLHEHVSLQKYYCSMQPDSLSNYAKPYIHVYVHIG